MPNPTYTPAQLADEVQTLAENYRGAVNEIDTDNGIFSDISTALQQKTGQVEPYDKNELASTISNELVVPTLIEKTITENGMYSAEDDNADGYSVVTVNVDIKSFVNYIVNAELNER